ncbi:SDR family NAD(P)-dependent oxidoreductase [Bacillus sp. Marseille-P3661]|uniref:SDR family NAD(P)-dependent oxidoreductase n=1 Tax=Bacillus sp. Marseille-P3661 TaxID=1936234 RepID=UPI000C842F3C|nr:glucose 1-dehydrogenase [Bacillus sp. Marseille-P3661]
MRFKDKVVIVSGTGPNIGIEVARTLAKEGANVVCADYLQENADAAADAVRELGREALAFALDIRDKGAIQSVVQETIHKFGKVDSLVNNAAITVNKGVLEIETSEWQDCIDINLTGTFQFCQVVARSMIDLNIKGSIVNIASTSGHRGRKNAIGYCSSKGGVLNMTRAMAMDLADYGIRVNSVSPTRTGTPVGVKQLNSVRTAPEIPLGRTGEPIDQALAVAYLASDESSFVTGMDIRVDGGALATWGVQEYRNV